VSDSPESSAHAIQLIDAWLGDFTFSNNPEFEPGGEVELHYGVESETTVHADLETGRSIASLRLGIDWRDSENEPAPGPFALSLETIGQLATRPMPEEKRESLEQWLEFMSPYLLWPYARAYVSSITSLSPHPPLTLFTRQVPQPRALEAETAEQHDSG
jgi:preprotein translocase subunit SecB